MEIATRQNFLDDAISVLKAKGYRITKTRRIIAETIGEWEGAFGAKELHQKIHDTHGGSLDFATVYRTLMTYLDLALVHKVSRLGKFMVCSHTNNDDQTIHIIFRCESCNEIEEKYFPAEINSMVQYIIRDMDKDFTTRQSVMNVTGCCDACQ